MALTFVDGELGLLLWRLDGEVAVDVTGLGCEGWLGRCLLDGDLLGRGRLLGNTGCSGSPVSEREVGEWVGEGFKLGGRGGAWLSNWSKSIDRGDGGDDEESNLRLGEHDVEFSVLRVVELKIMRSKKWQGWMHLCNRSSVKRRPPANSDDNVSNEDMIIDRSAQAE